MSIKSLPKFKAAIALKLKAVDALIASRIFPELFKELKKKTEREIELDLYIKGVGDPYPYVFLPLKMFSEMNYWNGEEEELAESSYSKIYCPSTSTAMRLAKNKHLAYGFARQFGLKDPVMTFPYITLPDSQDGFLLHEIYRMRADKTLRPYHLLVDFHLAMNTDTQYILWFLDYFRNVQKVPIVTYRMLLPVGKDSQKIIHEHCIIKETTMPWQILADACASYCVVVYGNSWLYHLCRTLTIPCAMMYNSYSFDDGNRYHYLHRDAVKNVFPTQKHAIWGPGIDSQLVQFVYKVFSEDRY